jgi:diguanylate cyclase (GGDEF)-like protein
MAFAQRTRIRLVRMVIVAFAAIGMLAGVVHAESTPKSALTQGAWRPVQPGDTPAGVLYDAAQGRLRRFDTTRMTTFPSKGLGSWVVLQPTAPGLQGARVLSLPSPPFGPVTLYDAGGPVTTDSLTTQDPALPAHGRIAFALPRGWSATAPILLKFEPSTTLDAPVKFHLQSRAGFRHADTLWLVMASASFAVMLAMGLMALCFAAMLRDATFAWYAAYVGSYAGLQAVQTGFVLHPLGLDALAPVALQTGAALTAVSVVSAVLFMASFCNLRRYAPWLRSLLLAMAIVIAMLAMLNLVDVAITRDIVHELFNPLLALCSGLMVLAGSVALFRGSRPALFFLFGWLPLLVLTAMASAQVGGALPDVDWLNQASLAAGAVESLVLAVGLADRTLNLRREHHRARELADKDPLTGIFNRRGWIEAAQRCLGNGRTHSLLFMDLDHFKTLNDELGHTAGDQALVAVAQNVATELRPQDLLGRFGGEEFVAMLCSTEREPALLVAQRLCRRLHRLEIPRNIEGDFLTLSIGLATRRPGDTLSTLLERADAAMYEAKSRGRNQVVDEQRVGHGRRPMMRAKQAGATEDGSGPPSAAPSRNEESAS